MIAAFFYKATSCTVIEQRTLLVFASFPPVTPFYLNSFSTRYILPFIMNTKGLVVFFYLFYLFNLLLSFFFLLSTPAYVKLALRTIKMFINYTHTVCPIALL